MTDPTVVATGVALSDRDGQSFRLWQPSMLWKKGLLQDCPYFQSQSTPSSELKAIKIKADGHQETMLV